MEKTFIDVSVKGRRTRTPAYSFGDRKVLVSGKWLKTATIHDEEWLDSPPIDDPLALVAGLLKQRPKPDIFSFADAEPQLNTRFSAYFEWDNVAVIRTTSYADWWNGLSQEARRNVRIAEKRGVSVKRVPFDDTLIKGIKGIYDETPIRQGRKFWHFGKDFETVKADNSSYADRSEFLGAFLNDELIGFIKIVYIGKTARLMQILTKNEHFDKRPANALIAKSVERCCEKGMSYFAYCRYVYGNKKSSSITEFKRRNGFEELRFPRYYFPLSLKGKLSLKLGLHRGIRHFIPEWAIEKLLELRSRTYDLVAQPKVPPQQPNANQQTPALAK